MKLTPIERAAYTRGHHDGERGNPPQSSQYSGRTREVYQRGYGKGFDLRYRADVARKEHGNKRTGPVVSPDIQAGPRRGSDASQCSDRSRVSL